MNDTIYRKDAIQALVDTEEIKGFAYRMLEDRLMEIPSADKPQGDVDAVAIFEHEMHNLEQGYITLGEFDERIEPLRHLCYGRPQGEWIPATWQDEYCPERLKKHKCSVCGHRAETVLVKVELVDNYYCNKAEPIVECTHKEQLSKYCPNCGAKMKGVDNEIFCR